MRSLDRLNFTNALQNRSGKIILILGIFAGLVGIMHLAPCASADYGMDSSSDLSSKIQVGKSSIGENSSSDMKMSGQSGSGVQMSGKLDSSTNASATKSQDEYHENSHASANEYGMHGHYTNAYEKN